MIKCYFKKISESTSQEGRQYKGQFPLINFQRCLYICSGYEGYKSCEFFSQDLTQGLEKMLKVQEIRS
jgi:hypothetical protein